jgi:hypothetical protein
MRRAVRVGIASVVVLLGLGARGPIAAAQVPPPPEQLTPVFELVSPIVSPFCGNASLLVGLGPALIAGQLGMPLPVDILPLVGPVVVVCGSIPAPPQRLTCSPDTTIRTTLDTITGTAAGTQLPIDTTLVGPAVEQTIVLQDMLPAPASTAGLAEMVSQTLTCTAAKAPTAPDLGPTEEEIAPETSAPESFDDVAIPDFSADVLGLGPLDSAPAVDQQIGDAALPQQLADLASGGFAYPIVFALPLVLLALGGYLGWALTQPVEPPQP